jgi:hypothetical protein
MARGLVGGSLVMFWVAMGANAGFSQLVAHVPLLGQFRYWEKAMVWPTLWLAVASSKGIDAILTDKASADGAAKAARWAAIPVGVTAAVLFAAPVFAASAVEIGGAVAAARSLVANATRGAAQAVAACLALWVVVAWAGRHRADAARWLLAAVLIIDAGVASRGAYVLLDQGGRRSSPLGAALRSSGGIVRVMLPFGPVSGRWSGLTDWENRSRWWARTLEAPWNVPEHVGNFLPYVGLVPGRMFLYQKETSFTPRIGVGLWGVSAAVVPDAPEAVAQVGVPPPYRAVGVDPELPAFAVEIPHRPRAYLAREVLGVDEAQALRFALNPGAVSSGVSVVEDVVPADGSPPRGTVSWAVDEACRIELEVETDRRALLVLNDTDAPGWTAAIDGQPAVILPANLLARGDWVTPGRNRVTFRYRTPMFFEGLAVALGFWAFVLTRNLRPGVQHG